MKYNLQQFIKFSPIGTGRGVSVVILCTGNHSTQRTSTCPIWSPDYGTVFTQGKSLYGSFQESGQLQTGCSLLIPLPKQIIGSVISGLIIQHPSFSCVGDLQYRHCQGRSQFTQQACGTLIFAPAHLFCCFCVCSEWTKGKSDWSNFDQGFIYSKCILLNYFVSEFLM